MNIKEIINKYHILAQKVAEVSDVYYKKLEFSGFSGVQPYIADEITEIIKNVRTNNDVIQIINKSGYKMADYFAILYNVNKTFADLTKVINVFNENKINLNKQGEFTSSGHTLTTNFIKETALMLVDVNQIYQVYIAETGINSGNIALRNTIILNLPEIKNVEQVEEINKIYLDYVKNETGQYVVELYLEILKYVIKLNENTKEGKTIVKSVIQTIESLKTNVLHTPLADTVGKQNRINVIQKLIQMYNLTPDTIARPLPELINEITGADTKIKSIDNLKNVCKLISNDRKFGFIVINKITRNPLIYNFEYLTNKTYLQAQDLWQTADVGINEKSLIRGRTIDTLVLNPDIEDGITVFDAEFSKDMTQNFYYIIETLDGTNYRALLPWSIETSHTYFIPAAWFVNIVDEKMNPSVRLSNYNLIINAEIKKHLTTPFINMEILSRDEISREESYWNVIRNKITLNIRADFESLFTMTFIDGSKNLNADNIYTLIQDFKLYRNLIYYITENIKIDNMVGTDLQNLLKLEFINQELIVSYINDLDKLQRGLQKDIEITYKEEYADKVRILLKDNKNKVHIRNKLTTVYENIMNDVLKKYISRRSNIYLVIRKKLEILEKTLKS